MRHVCVCVCVSAGPCSPQRLAEPGECVTPLSALTPRFPAVSTSSFPTLSQVRNHPVLDVGPHRRLQWTCQAGGAAVLGPGCCMCPPCKCGCCCISIRQRCLSSRPLSVTVFPNSVCPTFVPSSLCLDCLLLTGPASPAQEVSVEALLKSSGLSPERLLQASCPHLRQRPFDPCRRARTSHPGVGLRQWGWAEPLLPGAGSPGGGDTGDENGVPCPYLGLALPSGADWEWVPGVLRLREPGPSPGRLLWLLPPRHT